MRGATLPGYFLFILNHISLYQVLLNAGLLLIFSQHVHFECGLCHVFLLSEFGSIRDGTVPKLKDSSLGSL